LIKFPITSQKALDNPKEQSTGDGDCPKRETTFFVWLVVICCTSSGIATRTSLNRPMRKRIWSGQRRIQS